ncbi:hypothetical protein [Catellatospora sichuanensis]|uniref:hypothetical protein n=1 Tax=Catellatospora sichuanensis TaxID=1969805 RepID=UPI001183C285|nr:hypothetical protein [Catellatospora sichuanensis]
MTNASELPADPTEREDVPVAGGADRQSASAHIADVNGDRHRDLVRGELEDFGYTGDLAITDGGRAKARCRLDHHAAGKADRA